MFTKGNFKVWTQKFVCRDRQASRVLQTLCISVGHNSTEYHPYEYPLLVVGYRHAEISASF